MTERGNGMKKFFVNIGKFLRGKNTGKNSNRSRYGNFLIMSLMTIFGLFSILPMVLAINQAFKPIDEIFIFPPRIFVQNPVLSNFKMLFDLMSTTWVPFSRYIFNTILISVAGTVGNIIVCSMAAYPLAKHHKAPGVNFLFAIVTLSLMFNPVVGDIANYITMAGLNWIDDYKSIIVPAMATSLGLFLMRQFMVQIPDDMISSAKIDGASEYKVFWRIIMPQVKPAWLTLAMFSFQGLWTVGNTVYIYKEEFKTLGYAFSQIAAGGIIRIGSGAAASVVMMIVPIVFFILSQSQILQTMTSSGLKE